MLLYQRFLLFVVKLRDQDLVAVRKALRHRKRGCMMKSIYLWRLNYISYQFLSNRLFIHVFFLNRNNFLFKVFCPFQLKLYIRQNIPPIVSVLVSQIFFSLSNLMVSFAWLRFKLQAYITYFTAKIARSWGWIIWVTVIPNFHVSIHHLLKRIISFERLVRRCCTPHCLFYLFSHRYSLVFFISFIMVDG